jgi:L-lactate dehydrogenase complex protein LldE
MSGWRPVVRSHAAAGGLGRVGLFIPCYIDQAYPHVGLATVRVLEKLGVTFEYPADQTCCGQPMFNSGCFRDAAKLARKVLKTFRGFDYVVCPSGSCTGMIREYYGILLEEEKDDPAFRRLVGRTYELCEFIIDILGIERFEGSFPYRVGLHQSCHGLRGLGLGVPSELALADRTGKVRRLLESLRGLELVTLSRSDECCGFGGTFSVFEPAVSSFMGLDRLADHERAGAEIIASYDVSCLMHLEGLIRRYRKPLRVMHLAEILDEAAR